MRFNNYLNEKLNLNLPVKVTLNNKWTWQSTFEVGEVKYRFVGDIDADEENDPWAITFWNMTEPTVFAAGTTDITGKMGIKSLEVFSGVASALSKFIKARKPKSMFFSAEEPSRIKLYNRLAKMIARQFKYKLNTYTQEGDMIYEFEK